jgi:hypothetical protein
MPWKTRGSTRHYYRSVREGGRVRSVFLGSGPVAELAALDDRFLAASRIGAEAAWRDERAALDAEDRGRAELADKAGLVAGLAMEAAGFRKHDRGEWRRTRMGGVAKLKAKADVEVIVPDVAGLPTTRAEARELLARASKGDASAMPRVRELFRADPEGLIGACCGDLAAQAESSAIGRMAGENLAFGHAVAMKMESMRSELAGPESSAVERLLAARVASCWLEAHAMAIGHDQAMEAAPETLTFRRLEHFQKMKDHASRRYLQALRTLAAVKKLGPPIQINLATNQVNMASVGGRTDPNGCDKSKL